MRLRADRGVCIGAGQCAQVAPDHFDQDDDGLVVVLSRGAVLSEADAREVVDLCPSGALSAWSDAPEHEEGPDA